ncbi:MAG TPA: TetR/AcrR family transcriptional regulator [Negativicutes bacterium]|nr:TetR/AcrR family transcriptional regulator [Negativicutes bacterium]
MKNNHYNDAFTKTTEEKRSRIFACATAEFAEHGFDSANINRIAQASGVSIGAMYKYFDSKEELFLSIVHIGVETTKSVLGEIISSEGTLLQRIERIIMAIQAQSRSNVHLTMLYNEMATESHSELVWKLVSEMEGATAGLYSDLIKEAQDKGDIRKDIDPRAFAFFLDNLFIMLQYSYSCEYYKQRLKLYVGESALENDDLIALQLMKFVKGAFSLS